MPRESTRALLARREAEAGRPRVAPDRTAAVARRRARDARAVRLGARLPADEVAGRPADDPGQAARPRVRPHRPGREEQGADSARGRDLRPRARRPVPGRARGGRGAGAAIASPPGVQEQPELAAAALARLAENESLRKKLSDESRLSVEGKSFADVAGELERALHGPRQAAQATHARRSRSPTASGSSPTSTCTRPGRATARSRSRTCSTTRRRPGSGRSRSPTTTSSAARSRRSSSPATAT